MALYLLSVHPIHWTVFGNRISLPESTWSVAYHQLILRCLLKLGMVSEDDDDELVPLIVSHKFIVQSLGDDPSHCTSYLEWLLHSEQLVSIIVHLQQQPITSSSMPW